MKYLFTILPPFSLQRAIRFLSQPSVFLFLFLSVLAVSNVHAQVEAFEANMRDVNTMGYGYARIIVLSICAVIVLIGFGWLLLLKGGIPACISIFLAFAFGAIFQVFPGIFEGIFGWSAFNATP